MIASMDDVLKTYGDQNVLVDASAEVNDKDRIGVIGRNGAGKSTLLRVLLGIEDYDEGSVYVRPDISIGYMKQDSGLDTERTIIEEMRSVFADALDIQRRMESLTAQIEQNPEDSTLQASYDRAMTEFIAADGYNIDVRIRRVLTGMGFAEKNDGTIISTMSGGEKTRLALARLLLQEPDILVLDEPTNHLDMRTLNWLEEYLMGYSGALVIVSHDRFFLDRVTQSIWELEDGRLTTYRGNYTAYRSQRELRKKEQLREYEKQQAQIAELKDYIARNAVRASTASMAKAREKKLLKMERVPKPRIHEPVPQFHFEAQGRPWSEVLHVEGLDLRVGDEQQTIVSDISFDVNRGGRLAVLGANGTGKSTLLQNLLSALNTADPKVLWGRGAAPGYYEQENRNLRSDAVVVSEVQRLVPGLTEGEARSLIARMLLTGDDAFKLVGELSGGERAKLGLSILMGEKANVLLLDEPTNHLDLPAREALEEALRAYDGTLILVSHDRYFVNAIADHVLAISDGRAAFIEGNYDDYVAAEEERVRAAVPQENAEPRVRPAREQRRARAERRASLSAIEKEIAGLEEREKELRRILEEGTSDYTVLQQACEELEQVSASHDKAMEEWLELMEDE